MRPKPFAPLALALLLAGCLSPHSGKSAEPPPAAAGVPTMPAIFGHHMVLQAGKPITVWGWAPSKTRVIEVRLERDDGGALVARGESSPEPDGRFRLVLPPVAGSRVSHTFSVRTEGAPSLVFTNVAVGEVWVCSGQSNMQWPLRSAHNGNAAAAAATNALIRLFAVPNRTALEPREDMAAQWQVGTPDSAAGFSAVGYFFARNLHATLADRPPIGLVGAAWGGTPAQSWTSLPALQAGGFTRLTAAYAAVVAGTNPTPEVLARYEKELAEHLTSVDIPDRPVTEEARAWSALETPHADWPELPVPRAWERTAALENVNGAIWFRRAFDVPAAWTGRDLTLELGTIDDRDTTFFNGHPVGETSPPIGNRRAVARVYTVPAALVAEGPAVVAVRVFDRGGRGGIVGAPQRIAPADGMDGSIALAGPWRYRVEFAVRERHRPATPGSVGPNTPSVLYNATIHPLIPYAIAGVIWYQGESNVGKWEEYRTLFPAMIQDWRDRWGQGNFPFLWAQLANYMAREKEPSDPPWARLREAQTMALRLPATGQAVLIDVGEADDIHPRDKQSVGYRLSRAALRIAYGRDIVHSGPVYRRLTARDGALVVEFDSIGTGLEVLGERLKGFAIAGADGVFRWAQAEVEGDVVVVRHAQIAAPVAVRYAWGNNPAATLYNRERLPAVPFAARLDE